MTAQHNDLMTPQAYDAKLDENCPCCLSPCPLRHGLQKYSQRGRSHLWWI